MNYKLDTSWGKDFSSTAKEAKIIAIEEDTIVEFEFNGCICLVDENTNLKNLLRDYHNHWMMGWETIGVNCVDEYSDEIQDELERKQKIAEEKQRLASIEYQRKDKEKKDIFIEKTKDIKMEFSDEDNWNIGRSKNKDGYGNAIFQYAESWAKLMQLEILNGKTVLEIQDVTSDEADFLGISGFQHGAALSVLRQCWKYGKELK